MKFPIVATPFLSLSLASLAALGALGALGACKKRSYNDGNVRSTDLTKLKSDGIATIDWTCQGTGKQHPAGSNSQEEYCEWTRKPVAFKSEGTLVAGGTTQAVDLPKACVFTTSFDQSRQFFLTKNVVGGNKKEDNPFWATQFNSYAFLVGGQEPDTGTSRTGIIGHCIKGNDCFAPNCVPDRASDPQICRTLNQVGDKGCEVNTSFEVAPVMNAGTPASGRHGDRVVKPQLSVKANIAPNCWYVRDPKIAAGAKNAAGQEFSEAEQQTLVACDATALKVTNCDTLSPDISVVVTLRIKDTKCVGGTGSTSGPGLVANVNCLLKSTDGSSVNVRESEAAGAAVRTTLNSGASVFVRGFKGDWVSVQFKVGGVTFGAGNGTPSFIHKSQFDVNSCK